MKEKNMNNILHLVRKGGDKHLSTIKWESSLRGDGFYTLNKKIQKGVKTHVKIWFYFLESEITN